MTAAVVALATAVVVLAVVLGLLLYTQQRERAEWADERRGLVDRAIARHSGEVIALDRGAQQRPPRESEPRLVEGLT